MLKAYYKIQGNWISIRAILDGALSPGLLYRCGTVLFLLYLPPFPMGSQSNFCSVFREVGQSFRDTHVDLNPGLPDTW